MNIHVFRRLMSTVKFRPKFSLLLLLKNMILLLCFRRFQIDDFYAINFIM